MRPSFDIPQEGVRFLFPGENNIGSLAAHKSFAPFDGMACDFLNEVSQKLMGDDEARRYPDVITFAFFCRRASLQAMKKDYEGKLGGRLGRGITFHIAPSNVPINFAYSLVAGLLAGNRCIVRASSKDFPQTGIVCRALKAAAGSGGFKEMEDIISVVTYGHETGITDALSALADVRVIWGGDTTVAEIRKSPLAPRAFDVTFADRYSLAVISAGYVLAQDAASMGRIAQGFYNDTYLYDQNACSSPRLIVWLGPEGERAGAEEKFWAAVHEYIAERYELAPILAVDKLSAAYRCAVELDGVRMEKAADNLVTRVRLAELPEDVTRYSCAGGCWLEYGTEDLSDLLPVVTRKFQTLSYLGMDPGQLRDFVVGNGLSGIDRIVPVGRTADFGLVWDGYDLIMTMSRDISSL